MAPACMRAIKPEPLGEVLSLPSVLEGFPGAQRGGVVGNEIPRREPHHSSDILMSFYYGACEHARGTIACGRVLTEFAA